MSVKRVGCAVKVSQSHSFFCRLAAIRSLKSSYNVTENTENENSVMIIFYTVT